QCQHSPNPLTDLELASLLDALDADSKLTRAAVSIATYILKESQHNGFVDASIAKLCEVGRVTATAVVLITRRLRERGYFTIARGGSHKPNRFFPSKIPIQTERRRMRVTL